jgi:predicted dehydrogenase
MIHDLDIVLMMCGAPLEDVRAVGVSVLGAHEDVANARLHFGDGCVANLTVSRLAMKTERKLRVFSETAYITLDYARRSGLVVSAQENRAALEEVRRRLARGEDLSGLNYMEMVRIEPIQMAEEEPLKAELRHFLESVRAKAVPSVDASAGWAAVEAAERVLASLRGHRWEGLDGSRLP